MSGNDRYREYVARQLQEAKRLEEEEERRQIRLPVRFDWLDYQLGRFGYWVKHEVSVLHYARMTPDFSSRADYQRRSLLLSEACDEIRVILREKVLQNPNEMQATVLVEFHRVIDEIGKAVESIRLQAQNRYGLPASPKDLDNELVNYYGLLERLIPASEDRLALRLGVLVWQIIVTVLEHVQEVFYFYNLDMIKDMYSVVNDLRICECLPVEQDLGFSIDEYDQLRLSIYKMYPSVDPNYKPKDWTATTDTASKLQTTENIGHRQADSQVTKEMAFRLADVLDSFDFALSRLHDRFVQPNSLLQISQQEIVFSGRSVSTANFVRTHLAILWELARCCPEGLNGEVLKNRIGSSQDRISELVSRLRAQWKKDFDSLPNCNLSHTASCLFPKLPTKGGAYRLALPRSEIFLADDENPWRA